MGWIESEPLRLFRPCLTDELERCEAIEGFESLGIVVGLEEGSQVGLQPFVVVVVATHCRLPDPVDGHEHVELAFLGPHLGDVDVGWWHYQLYHTLELNTSA